MGQWQTEVVLRITWEKKDLIAAGRTVVRHKGDCLTERRGRAGQLGPHLKGPLPAVSPSTGKLVQIWGPQLVPCCLRDFGQLCSSHLGFVSSF